MTAGAWLSLFSGGKDSTYACWLAAERGLDIRGLVTVHPRGDSYMYHVPATHLAGLAAESMGLPLHEVEPAAFGAEGATDAGAQGDAELEPLEAALADLAADLAGGSANDLDGGSANDLEGGLAGITAGAVESTYQGDRIEAMADRLGADLFAPLWHRNPLELGCEMVDAGFQITIVRVAAAGLDASWLGRRLDHDALEDLAVLNEEYGVHVLGEGGEYETVVTDGPHMDRPIELDGEPEWNGTRGTLRIEDAWLG